jgi:hypothetical protein
LGPTCTGSGGMDEHYGVVIVTREELNRFLAEFDTPSEWKRTQDESERREQAQTRAEADRALEARLVALIGTQVGEQKELLLAVMAHALAAVRDEVIEAFEQKVAALEQQVAALAERQVRALQLDRSGEIIDLPNPFRKRVA